MSQSLFVRYRGKGFWAYDVPTKILARHLIDAAVKRAAKQPEAWLEGCIECWRANAIASEYGFYLDERWSEDQVSIVRNLLAEACDLLTEKSVITAEQMESWKIFFRGHRHFPVEPIVEEGEPFARYFVANCSTRPKASGGFTANLVAGVRPQGALKTTNREHTNKNGAGNGGERMWIDGCIGSAMPASVVRPACAMKKILSSPGLRGVKHVTLFP